MKAMGENEKLYQDRPLVDLEPYYSKHVSAMTTEGLYHKSDIATELAWRDKDRDRLKAENERLRAALSDAIDFASEGWDPAQPWEYAPRVERWREVVGRKGDGGG